MFLLTLFCFQPEMPAFIYSSLPPDYKTRLWFTICLVQEANQMLYGTFSASFIFQLHTLLPSRLGVVLKALAESARRCGGKPIAVIRIIGQIHVVQLMVSLFNVGHGNVTYCIKLLCITASIVNGYSAIAHGREDVLFLLFASCVTCDMVCFYAFMYEKAFAIPDGFERVKRALIFQTQGLRNTGLRKIIRKQLGSLPPVGLKVGDFHMLQRESTPIFVDYVLRNIVNLLVTV